jgi:hypothetical protein
VLADADGDADGGADGDADGGADGDADGDADVGERKAPRAHRTVKKSASNETAMSAANVAQLIAAAGVLTISAPAKNGLNQKFLVSAISSPSEKKLIVQPNVVVALQA